MKPEEAERIINDYGGAAASLPDGDAVLPLTALPYSKIRIRYAFYMYIEELIKMGVLEDEHLTAMVQTYALLNSRFQKDAEKINKLHKQYAKNEQARKQLDEYGGLLVGLPSIEEMEELTSYAEECHKVDFS
ncbi:MAG: hypothetical protein WAQ57_01265 [Candidatus Saccharimonadales bacterium]